MRSKAKPGKRILLMVALVLAAPTWWGNSLESSRLQSGLPQGALVITRDGKELLSIDVEIALTAPAQAKGLMGVESLPEDQGMAFLWSTPVRFGFFMKDTLIPLDIAFWDDQGSIVEILAMVPCTADPCQLYVPSSDYVGALEVGSGVFRAAGVKQGDKVALAQA
ncbi:MAG: DUF192 domain-containing protein [Actinomycetota bacterium]